MAKIKSCCVALFLMLAAVAAVPRRVNSIEGLPNDAHTLLNWFAQNVKTYKNEIWLNFDPSRGSYGSHHYRNQESLLETLPRGYEYYSIGNNNGGSFPFYVRVANEENRARIIIRVRRDNNQIADRVYITRHSENYYNSGYDSSQTYEVSVTVLQELRESLNENQQRAADNPCILKMNESSDDDSQGYSRSKQRYNTPATRPSSEDSAFPCLCCGCCLCIIVFLCIISVFFFLMVRNAKA